MTKDPESFRPPRRWRTPPAPLQGSGELEGISILREFPGDTGGLLWQSLRAVTLWAGIPPARRARLFNPGVAELRGQEVEQLPFPELREALRGVLGLLREPDTVDAGVVSAACVAVARWAAGRAAPTTEMDFLTAAALASPSDPALALTAARGLRDRGLYVHAEGWYQRSVALARRAEEWEPYARAYVGLGKTWSAQGRLLQARRSFDKAFRAARRHGIGEVQGMALHDLFALDAQLGDHASALRMAAAATRAYGPGHRLLPALAHDVARFWLERGEPGLALPVLQAVVPRLHPARRPVAVGNLGLAAAREGMPETFWEAWREVTALPDDAPDKAESLALLARGALALDLAECAEETIRRTREIAGARGELGVLKEMDELHHTLEADPATARGRHPEPEVTAAKVPAEAEQAAARLRTRLVAFLAASAPTDM
ncbi:MAG: hypothetical protein JO040_00240 [Gemmatimonadetes bacterium]|nr:hypothetical protein [Gemmatimonadota bacterium]